VPIEVTFRYAPGEYLRAFRKYQFSHIRFGPDLTASAILFGVGAWLASGASSYVWLGVIFVMMSLVFPVFYLTAFVMTARAIATNPRFRQEFRMSFSEQDMRFSTDSIESRVDWRFYRSALRRSGFYYLVYGRSQFTLLPERVLVEAGEKQAFEALLLKVLPKFEIAP
jgi:YcxB-like protein